MMVIHTYKSSFIEDKCCPYVVSFRTPSIKDHAEVFNWCRTVFGPPGYDHRTAQMRWIDGSRHGEVYFNREADVSMFILKWS